MSPSQVPDASSDVTKNDAYQLDNKAAIDKALRISEMRYRRLFETAQDGIMLINADTAQIEDINPFLINMLGYTHTEFLGKKIEAKEMKIAAIIALLHPFLILVFTAISSYLFAHNPTAYAGWLNNPGNHGFSEMLYEYTSSSANNGSGFEGLGDGVPFWNITCGIVMLLARFLPIIGPVAIAGILANKKYVPESAGTLKTDTSTFAIMVFAVIFIIAALSFFPALALGPIAEFFGIKS